MCVRTYKVNELRVAVGLVGCSTTHMWITYQKPIYMSTRQRMGDHQPTDVLKILSIVSETIQYFILLNRELKFLKNILRFWFSTEFSTDFICSKRVLCSFWCAQYLGHDNIFPKKACTGYLGTGGHICYTYAEFICYLFIIWKDFTTFINRYQWHSSTDSESLRSHEKCVISREKIKTKKNYQSMKSQRSLFGSSKTL